VARVGGGARGAVAGAGQLLLQASSCTCRIVDEQCTERSGQIGSSRGIFPWR